MAIWAAPSVPSAFAARDRVTRSIDSDSALVVLHAPTGYGKTVALAHWAAATNAHGVWLRVREARTSSHTFAQSLVEALVDAGEVPAEPSTAARDLLTGGVDPWELAARVLRRIPRPMALVVDQADYLDDDAARGLVSLVGDVPHLQVRASTRRATPLTEASLAVVLDARVIGPIDLALTAEEAAQVMGEDPDSVLVAEVMRAGAAPILAGALRAAPRGTLAPLGSVTLDVVLDSMIRTQSVREGWEPEFVDFLLSIAVADAVTEELAEQLSGHEDALALLERAEREGLGMWTHARSGDVFALSPHWRERLEIGLTSKRAGDLPRLRALTAAWSLEHGLPFTALRLAVAEGDWAVVDGIVRRHWYDLISAHARQVRELFAGISALRLRRHPLVTMMLAILYNARGSSRLRATEYFALSALGAREQRTTADPAERVLLRTIESVAMRLTGRIGAATRAADEAFGLLSSMSEAQLEELGRNRATVYNHVGTTFFYSGRGEEAAYCFRHSAALVATGLAGGLQGLASLAALRALAGDMPEAVDAAAEARSAVWPEGWIGGYTGSLYQVGESIIALEAKDIDRAESHLRVLDPHRRTIEHWSLLAWLETVILLERHEPERAMLRLATIEREQRERRAASAFQLSRIGLTRSLAALASGDLAGASKALTIVRGDPIRVMVARARAWVAAGESERALSVLAAAPDDAPRSSRANLEYLGLRAAAVAMEGGLGPEPLERVVDLLDDRGQRLALAFVPVPGLEALLGVARTSADARVAERVESALGERLIPAVTRRPRLTPRERVVASQLALDGSTASIAEALSVSENTVKSQLRSLYRKLGVTTRAEALRALAAEELIADAARLPPRE